MYAFVIARPGQTDCVVRISRHDDRDDALVGLTGHVADWAKTHYGIDLSDEPAPDKVVVSAPSATAPNITMSRYVTEPVHGIFYNSTALVPRLIASFTIVDSTCIGHATHARLVDQIADEISISTRAMAELASVTAINASMQTSLDAANERATTMHASFSDLLCDHTMLQRRVDSLERELTRVRAELTDANAIVQARLTEASVINAHVSDAVARVINDTRVKVAPAIVETTESSQPSQTGQPTPLTSSALSAPALIDELTKNRPRLISRRSRDEKRRLRQERELQRRRDQAQRDEIAAKMLAVIFESSRSDT